MFDPMHLDAESPRDGARFAILKAATVVSDGASSLLAEDEVMAALLVYLDAWRAEAVREGGQ
jgi:hypothetical protein